MIGNLCTFESMPVEGYPLLITEDVTLRSLLSDPHRNIAIFRTAASIGQAYVREHHSEQRFDAQWIDVMTGAAAKKDIGNVG